jgi:hypothetical protein
MRLRHLFVTALGGAVLSAAPAQAAGGPIMPLPHVHAGMDCTGRTVVQGTTITSFGVHVIDIVQDPQQGPRILISVSGPAVDRTGVAEGFSGSPVLCDDGTGTLRNIGAVSETIGEYGNKIALVTPIEQMLGEAVSPPSSAQRLSIRGRPLRGPLTVGGLSPALQALVRRAGHRAGRTILTAGAASAALSFPVQPLIPGASVSTMYSTGAISVGAVGTVTYRDGNTVYAFGHPLDGVGRRSLILGDAYVYYVVNNPSTDITGSYKLAAPGHPLGTLTSDTPNAVIGSVPKLPATTPVDVTARDRDTRQRVVLHTDVADETDVGNPTGSALVSTVTPLAVGQAASAVFDGAPANETGHMCLSVSLREAHTPLRFCNRYVGSSLPGSSGALPPILSLLTSTDVTSALGLLDAQSFARLHVTHVAVTIDAQRGLKEAMLLGGRAPKRVRAGQLVRVHLRVRRYRAGIQRLSFRIRIPHGAHGRVVARIGAASTLSGADALANLLVSALFGDSGGSSGGGSQNTPQSLPALRRSFAKVGRYDGLRVRFGKRTARRAYRNPRLLLTGQAKLVFAVSK